jgi:hypothetical protein
MAAGTAALAEGGMKAIEPLLFGNVIMTGKTQFFLSIP